MKQAYMGQYIPTGEPPPPETCTVNSLVSLRSKATIFWGADHFRFFPCFTRHAGVLISGLHFLRQLRRIIADTSGQFPTKEGDAVAHEVA